MVKLKIEGSKGRRAEFLVSVQVLNLMPIHFYATSMRVLNGLKEKAKSEYVANTFTAISAAYLKETDEAFDYFEKAFMDRDPILLMLKYVQWVPVPIREDPRFQNLLDRIGFPE